LRSSYYVDKFIIKDSLVEEYISTVYKKPGSKVMFVLISNVIVL